MPERLSYGDGDGIFHALDYTGLQILDLLRGGATLHCMNFDSEMKQPLCGEFGYIFKASDGYFELDYTAGVWTLREVMQDEVDLLAEIYAR